MILCGPPHPDSQISLLFFISHFTLSVQLLPKSSFMHVIVQAEAAASQSVAATVGRASLSVKGQSQSSCTLPKISKEVRSSLLLQM